MLSRLGAPIAMHADARLLDDDLVGQPAASPARDIPGADGLAGGQLRNADLTAIFVEVGQSASAELGSWGDFPSISRSMLCSLAMTCGRLSTLTSTQTSSSG